MINRSFFFEQCSSQLFAGVIKAGQRAGLTAILDQWETLKGKNDDRFLAYMLATTHHETDRRMQAIKEYGLGKGRAYGKSDPVTGHIYYGRGFVQLTWKANYETMGKRLQLDLVHRPELALNLAVATKILFVGMAEGRFTGKKLRQYFNATTQDWVKARRIINGLDKAQLIADYAKKYYSAISYTV